MEIEKPFKCSICSAQFTNEDHLQVHKKRHEMSLNLKVGSQQSQPTLDSFVDETPTPTRFFRNCEEVGLFQDLQNVNPFDEQFSKAAGSTPSTSGAPFDFSITMSSSSISVSAASAAPTSKNSSTNSNSGNNNSSNSNKRRYSDQDTLNTPQVFGYVMNSTSSSTTNTCSTTSILTPMPPSASITLDKDHEKVPVESKQNENEDEKLEVKNLSKDHIISQIQIPTVPSKNSSTIVSTLYKPTKSKTMLRLNLSPITPVFQFQVDTADTGSASPDSKKLKTTPAPKRTAERLERNRAAALRSRQRRKQWISSLESKCKNLESMLAQAKAEIANQQAELQILRGELLRHGNCDVTRRCVTTSDAPLPTSTQSQQIQILVQQRQPQPNILRQISQPVVVTNNTIVVSPNCDASSIPHQPVFVTPFIMPRMKAKRGRPRRGQERRIALVNAPAVTEISEVPVKVQIMPVNRTTANVELKPSYILGS